MNRSTPTLCTVVCLLTSLSTPSADGTRTGRAPAIRTAVHVPGFSPPSKITALLAASSSQNRAWPTVDWTMAAASQSSDHDPTSRAVPPCLRSALSVSLASSPTVLYGLVSPRARLALSADVLPAGADVLRHLFASAARTPSQKRPEIETGAPDQFASPAGVVYILDPVKNTGNEQKPSVLHATPLTAESAKKLKPLFRPVFPPVGL